MKYAVFHKIGEPSKDKMTHSIEQILDYDGTITFDGAYESVYRHRKIVKDREPILFVQGNSVGAEGVMSWEKIMELHKLGFVLGWHGWTHRPLTELPDYLVINELQPYNSAFSWQYAYPHGEFDERTKKLVKDMGYLRAYSTTQGIDGDDFAIPREYI